MSVVARQFNRIFEIIQNEIPDWKQYIGSKNERINRKYMNINETELDDKIIARIERHMRAQ